jgi:membrane-bound lytic murein transglycosylase D
LKAGQTLVFYPEKAPAIEKPASSGSAGTSRPEPEATTRENAPQETERSTYVVSQGETLYGISRKLGVSMGELARWNNKDLTHPRLRIGERLQYQSPSPGNPPAPSPGKKATGRTIQYRIQPGDNLSRLAGLFSVSIDDLQEMNGLSGGSILHIGDTLLVPSAPSGSRKGRQDPARIVYYEVKKGDNLWTIARKFSIPLDRLLIANDLDRGAVLMPGDTIRVVLLEDK